MGDLADGLAVRIKDAEEQGVWMTPSCHAEEVLLRRRLGSGDLVSPFRGMYGLASTCEDVAPRERAVRTVRTLARRHPNWVFCLYSAALVHGLQVPNAAMGNIHYCSNAVTVPGTGLVRHRVMLEGDDAVVELGVRVTSLRRTIVDCLCASDFRTGLAMVDSVMHWDLASAKELEAWLEEDGRGKRGVRRARESLRWADGRSENGGESFARAVMIELGFAIPELQVEVFDPMEPDNPKRGDFGWRQPDGTWIIGELDGLGKYTAGRPDSRSGTSAAVRALSDERRRESHLSMGDNKIVRFSMREVLDTAYFEKLLATAGVPRREGGALEQVSLLPGHKVH